ncbi:MAG: GerMN domain-containing protein [Limnochordaceae bacterium]|nr:GerMN domain-containing protein [Limnochordaceae bacterium]
MVAPVSDERSDRPHGAHPGAALGAGEPDRAGAATGRARPGRGLLQPVHPGGRAGDGTGRAPGPAGQRSGRPRASRHPGHAPGPSPGETSGQSLYTQIPEGTRLLSVRLQGETAFLNFSREFEQTGGTQRLAGMLRQVVFTATAVPPVRKVVLLVEGEQVGTETHPFTGDGLLFGELSRDALPL